MEETVLRVTVDDVGLAPEVAQAALELSRAGLPVAASVCALGAAPMSQARRLGDAGIPVGAHLVLTQEMALSGPGPLTDGEGRLPSSAGALFARWARGSFPTKDAIAEISLQLELFADSGIRPSHLDGHEHMHAWPPLAEAVAGLARRFAIPRLRDVSSLGRISGRRWLRGVILSAAGKRLHGAALREDLAIPDMLWGFDVSGGLDFEWLERILRRLPPGRHELVTHPAVADLPRYASWGYSWRKEFEVLKDPGFRTLAERLGVVLAADD